MRTRVLSVVLCSYALGSTITFGQPGSKTQIATLITLPSLPVAGPAEALAVDRAGAVIVGHAWDRDDLLHAVKWTRQDGSWTIQVLPEPTGAICARAFGVNDYGDTAGHDFPSSSSHAVLWPATGGSIVLGCNDDVGPATVYGISSGGQTVVGQEQIREGGVIKGSRAAVWQPGACRTDLPGLSNPLASTAAAVNADGTIVGGASAPSSGTGWVPVRWTFDGLWHVQQLDTRSGRVRGSNGAGDLAGLVKVPYGTDGCVLEEGCNRGMVWYADGGSRQFGTLGGAHSIANDINGSGEVVGMATSSHIGMTAFLWSASLGLYQLPFKGEFAVANAISDMRSDGTRVVVGMNSQAQAMAWVVKVP